MCSYDCILSWIVLEQNCFFQLNQQYYKQTEELAMDTPTTAILAEVSF
jgi:hypothetical protein